MTDTARVLLIAGVLSLSAAARFAFRLQRLDRSDPVRLIGQLRLSQAASILLATMGGLRLGLAVANDGQVLGRIDLFLGVAMVMLAATVQSFDPPRALRLSAAGFLLLALFEIVPHAAGSSLSLSPAWLATGVAAYDLGAAAVCFWAARH